MSKITQVARELFARQIEAQGPQWMNMANSVRAGFENLWVTPGLLAIDRAIQFGAKDADGGSDSPD